MKTLAEQFGLNLTDVVQDLAVLATPSNHKDFRDFGAHRMNLAARDVVLVHCKDGPFGPNRKARRAMAAFERSRRARVAAYRNQHLIPAGALHPYAQ